MYRSKPTKDVAVIGMSCLFPGADGPEAFWQNIVNKVDSTGAVPADRLDPVHFESSGGPFYCSRGGFVPDYRFDPRRFGILPVAVEGTEPDHLLTLDLVHRALEDAGMLGREAGFGKTGIIIGKGNYAGPGATRAIEIVRTGEQIASLLRELLPDLPEKDIARVTQEYRDRKGRFGPDTAMGLIPNLVASLVANRFNFGGTALTVDAACASSLIAIDQARRELTDGRADLMIAGGVHVAQNAAFWSIFTQLGALSRRGQIQPFSEEADGLLIGEGCGFVVLKRLEDARRDNDRIYAILKGTGVSSDGSGASVMSPSVSGQLRAMQEAWADAGTPVSQIGYIEAHGTGTPLGDKTEVETLRQFFGEEGVKAGLGTVKANIGHAMPAAGIAGFIKTCLALYHDTLPPTLHCGRPLPQLAQTRFQPQQEPVRWSASGLPRIAGVNAFGFGGINAHAVLEGTDTVVHDPLLLLARESREELLEALDSGDFRIGSGPYRLALFDPTPERLKRAAKVVARNMPWRGRQDMWYTSSPLLSSGGKLAFVFPGLDGLAGGEVDSVSRFFAIDQPVEDGPEGLLREALTILHRTSVLDRALKQMGVRSDLNAGHSLGEWLAARSSGLAEESSVSELLQTLNPETFELKDSAFIAVGCGIAQLEPLLAGIPDVYLSNDNCPQQVILCGTHAALDRLVPLLKEQQIFHQILPFQSGFHSPFVASKIDVLLAGMERMQFRKTETPLWSATTLEPYPEGLEAIRQLSVEHLIRPVRFRELTERLYEEGVRVFIQVGSGGLNGFIEDTLKGREFSTVASNVPIRGGLAQLQRVKAALFAEGREIPAFEQRIPPAANSARTGMKLELGLPILKDLPAVRALSVASKKAAEPAASPLFQAFQRNVDEWMDIQGDLLRRFQEHRPAAVAAPVVSNARTAFEYPLDISLQNSPYLIDHALLRQPKNWPHIADMDPVVPMTMIFELFGDIAAIYAPDEVVRKIHQVKVFQWMNVVEPLRGTVTGTWKTPDRVFLDLDRYANAEVELWPAAGGGEAPAEAWVLDRGERLPVTRTPEQIYEEHMFHGPRYQGIREVSYVGTKGITGIIESSGGKGSLLDNAGQLFGLWLQLTLTKDRIAFPAKIQEIEFFGDREDQSGRFECTCVLTELNDDFATGNFELRRNGQLWARLSGWQNRRLEIDEALWRVSMAPMVNRLSEEIAPGVFFFHQAYSRVVSWDFVLKRYFNQEEKAHYLSLTPNRRKAWMISRVAVKDAVRDVLLKERNAPCYPISFAIGSEPSGQPYTTGGNAAGIYVSLAHKGTDAVGIARSQGPVGIDIERIEERGDSFASVAFTEGEKELLRGRDTAEWPTRFWVAKEACGKYLGTGLKGDPKALEITEIQGDVLKIKNILIQTIHFQNFIIGWTQP
jgi:3-oxoacyl-(acyl-carrier-protein) synthase/malonyl CoA-acyl carrier protein transacylase/phosphopantetheinyl transferase